MTARPHAHGPVTAPVAGFVVQAADGVAHGCAQARAGARSCCCGLLGFHCQGCAAVRHGVRNGRKLRFSGVLCRFGGVVDGVYFRGGVGLYIPHTKIL